MKRSLSIAVILCLVVSFFGCKMTSDYYKELSDYEDIWYLEGMRIDYLDHSPIFPASIESLEVQDFFCRHDIMFPVGEEIQIYLEVKYDTQDFSKEVERIKEAGTLCSEWFDRNLNLTAYCVELGKDINIDDWEADYEYALVDESLQTVYYIYMIYLDEHEIEFPKEFLPTNFTGYSEKIMSLY